MIEPELNALEPNPRRKFFVDLAPLRDLPEYRKLVFSSFIGTLGAQLTIVALAYQVYQQTHSSFQVGAISLAQLFPLIVGSLIGGSLGDAFDRRTIMWISNAGMAVTSGAFALNSVAAHPSLWVIYLVTATAAALLGLNNAAQYSTSATLAGPKYLSAAAAFTQIVFGAGVIIGPAIAGLLISVAGVKWVFLVDAASLCASAIVLFSMKRIPPVEGAARPGINSIREGGRYLKGNQPLLGIFVIDINAMVFGMPRALFPALALTHFHVGARGLGYLYSGPAVGAFLGSIGSGWVGHVRRRGASVIVAVLVWGAAITAFGVVRIYWLALLMLVVAGWADVISAVFRSTILQTNVPEEFRSRLSSIQMAVVTGGPRLGDLESGAVASAVSVPFSVVSGGLACIVGALVTAVALPKFTKHERPDA